MFSIGPDHGISAERRGGIAHRLHATHCTSTSNAWSRRYIRNTCCSFFMLKSVETNLLCEHMVRQCLGKRDSRMWPKRPEAKKPVSEKADLAGLGIFLLVYPTRMDPSNYRLRLAERIAWCLDQQLESTPREATKSKVVENDRPRR